MQAPKAKTSNRSMGFENLEDRRLMAASIDLIDGQVWIEGSNGHDTAVVNYNNHGTASTADDTLDIQMIAGGQLYTASYGAGQVSDIIFSGRDGNDQFTNNTGVFSLADGGNGNDLLNGGWGGDVLKGGNGNDTLLGNNGNDTLYGGFGNDKLVGGRGSDYLSGQAGWDNLYGDFENSDPITSLMRTTYNDIMHGGDGNDLLHGGHGNDVLYGENGDDYLFGAGGNDWIFGGNGDDYLIGAAGNDVLHGGAGADKLWGGPGWDWLFSDSDDLKVLHDGW